VTENTDWGYNITLVVMNTRKKSDHMRIYLIRHGETPWNKEKRLQGRTDIPLNEYGLELGKITAEGLKDVKFDAVFSSPLIRAVQTAQCIVGNENIEIVTDDRLTEMNFGESEGDLLPDIYGDENHPANVLLNKPHLYKSTPKGENFEDVIKRTGEFLKEVILPIEKKYNTILITGHGAMIRCLIRNIEPRPIETFWTDSIQKNCSVNIIDLVDGKFNIVEEGKLFYDLPGVNRKGIL